MSTQITIQGSTFNLPSQSDSPPWGDNLDSIITALVNVANNTTGTGDILPSTFTIANNQSSVANITGLSFNVSTVRGAIIEYSVYRNTNTNELSETGNMVITYKNVANTWEIAQYNVGSSGVTFSITTSGQFQYVSSNITGTSYVGKMSFKARAQLQ